MKPDLRKESTNFSRGLNSKTASHLINGEEVQVSENFLFDEKAPYVRKGYTLYNSTSISGPIYSMEKMFNRDGSGWFCTIAGDTFNAANLSGTFVRLSTVAISGAKMTIYGERAFITCLSTPAIVFNGSSVRYMGISGPSYQKKLAYFESDEVWSTGVVDTVFTHINQGTRAWKINTSGPHVLATSGSVIANLSTRINMAYFTTISSVNNDIISLFVLPEKRANVSTIDLIFDANDGTFSNYSTQCYWARISNLSSYVSISSDGIGAVHTLRKSDFSAPVSTVYTWSSVTGIRLVVAQKSNPAVVSFDSIIMQKTPPRLSVVSSPYDSTYTVLLVYGKDGELKRRVIDDENKKKFRKTLALMKAEERQNYRSITPLRFKVQDKVDYDKIKSGITSGVTYFYRATFIKPGYQDVYLESNPTFETSGIYMGGNGSTHYSVKITDIPISDDPDVCGRRVYRRNENEDEFRHVYTISDNVTEELFDDFNDADLTHLMEFDHDTPPKAKYIMKGNNQRLYMYNIIEEDLRFGSRVRWSEPYEVEYFPLFNSIDISPDDGSEGTGMFEYLNLIHLLKPSSTWMIDENNNLRNMHSQIGCVASDSIAIGNNAAYWLANGSVIEYKMTFKKISEENQSGSIKDILDRLPSEYIKNAAGMFFNGYYFLAVTDTGSTVNNLVLAYHANTETWTTFPNITVRSWAVLHNGVDPYSIFFGNYSGQVFQLFNGNYDHSSHISSKIRTKDFGVASPETVFRKGFLFTESLDGASRKIQAVPYLDFVNTSSLISLSSGTGHTVEKFSMPQLMHGNFCSIEFSSSGRYRINQLDLYGKEEELR